MRLWKSLFTNLVKMERLSLDQLKYRLNLIIIALLCSTTLAPCVIFYFRGAGEIKWMVIFMIICYLISLIPLPFYDRIQLSSDLNLYKMFGVHIFKKFSTNGDFINRQIKKKYPDYANIKNLESVKEMLKETYIIERAHTVLFVFCLFTNIYAFLSNLLITASILFTGNILFNFYPILLQQYNRNRYKKFLARVG